jgi:hypothetical protein
LLINSAATGEEMVDAMRRHSQVMALTLKMGAAFAIALRRSTAVATTVKVFILCVWE